MPTTKEMLLRKWWFISPVAFGSVFSLSWLLRQTGLSTDLDSFVSPLAFVHYMLLLGLWTLYSDLGSVLVLRVWPMVARFVFRAKSQ